MNKELSSKYRKIWLLCLPYFKNGRPGDKEHGEEIVNIILNYRGRIKFDNDILVPVAMMHDIGHAAILPEHFSYITGFDKLINGKLVHMLAGAKIARDILKRVGYNKKKSQEIIDIISMHDGDQLKGVDIKNIYDTKHKKIFHDFDSLDRYNDRRIKGFLSIQSSRQFTGREIIKKLESFLELFFYNDIKKIAEDSLNSLKDKYE